MKRPPLLSFFAALLFLEAIYELLLFPMSRNMEEMAPLLNQLPASMDIIVPFGIAKGFYALIGAFGLWFRQAWVKFYLWFVTPLFPIASIILAGTIGLAPLGFIFTLLYVMYLRKPEHSAWLNAQPSEKTPLIAQVESKANPINELSFKRIASQINLFLGGYFVMNAITTLALFSWPIDFSRLSLWLFQLVLASGLTYFGLKIHDYPSWKKRLGNLLSVVSIILLVYAGMLLVVLDTAEFDSINALFDGAISGKYVLQISLYAFFLLMIGVPLKRSALED
jgi:hypothetical protein